MKTLTNSRIYCVILIVLTLVCGSAISVAAKGPVPAKSDEEGRQTVLPTASVTLAKKTLESVITNVGDTYSLSKETIIVGLDGRQLSIRKMPVPCEATITYTREKGTREAVRIAVRRYSQDATRHWTAKQPE